ncbi:STAS domain-containing protein [Tomitella cavernea]|nr:STAS domain-containing protein [Tomitella cavernea]
MPSNSPIRRYEIDLNIVRIVRAASRFSSAPGLQIVAGGAPSRPEIPVVAVSGEVDARSSAAFAAALQALADAREGGVVMDLSGVEFIDSSGLAALIDFGTVMRDRNLTWSLCALRSVARPLRILDEHMGRLIVDDIGDAVASVRGNDGR